MKDRLYEDRVFPCSCHDFHFMRFTEWPEVNSDFLAEAYISIGGTFWRSWKDRFKAAWHVLRGCETHSNEMVLSREYAVELRNALEEYLWDNGYESPPFHSCTPGCVHPPRRDFNVEAARERLTRIREHDDDGV